MVAAVVSGTEVSGEEVTGASVTVASVTGAGVEGATVDGALVVSVFFVVDTGFLVVVVSAFFVVAAGLSTVTDVIKSPLPDIRSDTVIKNFTCLPIGITYILHFIIDFSKGTFMR